MTMLNTDTSGTETLSRDGLFILAIKAFFDAGGTVKEAIDLIHRVANATPNAVFVHSHTRGLPIVKDPEKVAQEEAERKGRVKKIIVSRCKTSTGVPWSEIHWYELPGMVRDSKLAQEFMKLRPEHAPDDENLGTTFSAKECDRIVKVYDQK